MWQEQHFYLLIDLNTVLASNIGGRRLYGPPHCLTGLGILGADWPVPPSRQPWCGTCPAGWASTAIDAQHCSLCSPGSFAASRRSPKCAPCANGTYAYSWGSTHCNHCIIGTFAPRMVGFPACQHQCFISMLKAGLAVLLCFGDLVTFESTGLFSCCQLKVFASRPSAKSPKDGHISREKNVYIVTSVLLSSLHGQDGQTCGCSVCASVV